MSLSRRVVMALGGMALVPAGWLVVAAAFSLGHRYPLTEAPSAPSQPARRVRGAIHVHTVASDGRGTLEEIARAAREAGLSFVVVTDHNPEALLPPRFLEGVLFVFGEEASTPFGHLVVLGANRTLSADERATRPIDAAQALGGFTVLAHPVQWKNPWRDWDGAGRAHGLELLSADTMLREALSRPGRLACAVGAFPFNPPHALSLLVAPPEEATLALLGAGMTSPVVLCSHDAHGLPDYAHVFRAMATHLPTVAALPESPEAAASAVLEAVRSGSTYCGLEALAPGGGLVLEGLGDHRSVKVGERLKLTVPPAPGVERRIVVSGPGVLVGDATGERVELEATAPGLVMVRVDLLAPGCAGGRVWRPWLVPSPVLARR